MRPITNVPQATNTHIEAISPSINEKPIQSNQKKPSPWTSVYRFTLIVLVYGGRSANQHENYEADSQSIDCGLSMMFILKQSVNLHPKWFSSMGGIA